METNTTQNTKRKGFILRSALNHSRILLTTDEFGTECFIGPGTGRSAKIYKTANGAEKAAKRFTAIVEELRIILEVK